MSETYALFEQIVMPRVVRDLCASRCIQSSPFPTTRFAVRTLLGPNVHLLMGFVLLSLELLVRTLLALAALHRAHLCARLLRRLMRITLPFA